MNPDADPTIFFRPASELPLAECVRHIPVLPDAEHRALADAIRRDGVAKPALVDADGGVVDPDGKDAVEACLRFDPDFPVPCLRTSREDTAIAAMEQLCLRHHLTKSARAFIAIGIHRQLDDEAENRRISNLKKGAKSPSPTQWASGNIGETCALIGIGREFWRMARKVRELFETRPEVALEYEPKLMAGDISLGGILQAEGGRSRYRDGSAKLEKRAQHGRLAREWFGKATKQLEFWDDFDEEEQQATAEIVSGEILRWPEALREKIIERIEREGRKA